MQKPFITIPNLIRVAHFTCKKPKDCVNLAVVNRHFRETMIDFHGAISVFIARMTSNNSSDERNISRIFNRVLETLCAKKHKTSKNTLTWIVGEFLVNENLRSRLSTTFPDSDRYPLISAIHSSQSLIVEAILDHAHQSMKQKKMSQVEENLILQIECNSTDDSNSALNRALENTDGDTLTVIFDYLEKFQEVRNQTCAARGHLSSHPNRVLELITKNDFADGKSLLACSVNKDLPQTRLVIEKARSLGCLKEVLANQSSSERAETILTSATIVSHNAAQRVPFPEQKQILQLLIGEINKIDDKHRTLLKAQLVLLASNNDLWNNPLLHAAKSENGSLVNLLLDVAEELGCLKQVIENVEDKQHSKHLLLFAADCFYEEKDGFLRVLERVEKVNRLRDYLMRKSERGMSVLHLAINHRARATDKVKAVLQKAKQLGIAETLLKMTNTVCYTPLLLALAQARWVPEPDSVTLMLIASCKDAQDAKKYICEFQEGIMVTALVMLDKSGSSETSVWMKDHQEKGDWYDAAKAILKERSIVF